MTTVVLADDHEIVRAGLRAVLGAKPDITIVGEAADGLETVRVCEQLRPDVLVVDLSMPGLGGLEVAHQVRQRGFGTRVVVQSMHAAEAYVVEALRRGVIGYVLKGSQAGDIVEAVRAAGLGQRYFSPPLVERAIEAYVRSAQQERADPYDALTTREREVLHMAAEGLTLAGIGERLMVSRRTVETHRANMMRKLGLRTQTDLVRYAIERGILSSTGPA